MNEINLSRFESIGNNCEFAFFLRQNKMEIGSLFRWTLIHDFTSIVNLISANFDSLYLYENLQPTYRNMIRDKHYNIDFHTEMFSEQKEGKWEWCCNEDDNYKIYLKEKEKINYLVGKFKKSLKDFRKIFVMKQNERPTLGAAYEISQLINKYGNANVLCVEETTVPQQCGKVYALTDNLYLGFVDHFAPYDKADHVSLFWNEIVENTLHLIDEN